MMPKLDRLKEELHIQKQLLFITIAVELTVMGWLATNLHQHWLLLVVGVVVVFIGIMITWTLKLRLSQLLEEVEHA